MVKTWTHISLVNKSMKQIIVHKRFLKEFRKLAPEIQKAFQKRRDSFLINEKNPVLHAHGLTGKFSGYKSFNVTADVRVIYQEISKGIFLFVTIGTHSELYS